MVRKVEGTSQYFCLLETFFVCISDKNRNGAAIT
jgi:hypothetical protein